MRILLLARLYALDAGGIGGHVSNPKEGLHSRSACGRKLFTWEREKSI